MVEQQAARSIDRHQHRRGLHRYSLDGALDAPQRPPVLRRRQLRRYGRDGQRDGRSARRPGEPAASAEGGYHDQQDQQVLDHHAADDQERAAGSALQQPLHLPQRELLLQELLAPHFRARQAQRAQRALVRHLRLLLLGYREYADLRQYVRPSHRGRPDLDHGRGAAPARLRREGPLLRQRGRGQPVPELRLGVPQSRGLVQLSRQQRGHRGPSVVQLRRPLLCDRFVAPRLCGPSAQGQQERRLPRSDRRLEDFERAFLPQERRGDAAQAACFVGPRG